MVEDIYRAIGERVRAQRKKLGWSQEELGERAGLHFTYVGKLERGEKKVSVSTLQKMASALGLKMAGFFAAGRSDPAPRPYPLAQKISRLLEDSPVRDQQLVYKLAKELRRSGARRVKRA